jgi:hypothetical protein
VCCFFVVALFVFVRLCLLCPILPVSLDCPFLNAPLVFSVFFRSIVHTCKQSLLCNQFCVHQNMINTIISLRTYCTKQFHFSALTSYKSIKLFLNFLFNANKSNMNNSNHNYKFKGKRLAKTMVLHLMTYLNRLPAGSMFHCSSIPFNVAL